MNKSATSPEKNIILALDFPEYETGKTWIRKLKDRISIFKVGPVMFLDRGLSGLEDLAGEGVEFFIDLKFHDIPNTVVESAGLLLPENVSMFTVHSLGGLEMMRSVCRKVSVFCNETGAVKPMVLAVTVLTSHGQESLKDIGINSTLEDEVLRLAHLAERAGIDGLVCSGLEAGLLKNEFGDRFKLVVPGVRLDSETQDQKRVVTPSEAFSRGADYIVVGRSVTQSHDPDAAVDRIIESISGL